LKNSINLETELLLAIASQLMTSSVVELHGKRLPIHRTSSHRLRTVSFVIKGQQYQAIEQNPDKPSRWGKLAREGHRVVQFKDVDSNKFVAVAVDGKIIVYGSRN
jgi:hypothetical protein